jgi:hypothetical protein
LKKQISTFPLRLPASLKATAEFFAERREDADIDAARRLLRRPGGSPPRPEDRMP